MESNLEQDLRAHLEGEVRFDDICRKIYSVDASIYEVEPIGIVIPKTREDVIFAVQIAEAHGISVIPRGAATGITGSCLGKGLIIDTSKYLDHILHIDYEKGYALCEPGVVQDTLNQALSGEGYRLGPDTSTGNRATLGGMLANNSAGARSLRYGKMVDHVEAVEMVLANGEIIRFRSCTPVEWEEKCLLNNTEGHIYRTISKIKKEYSEEIEKRFPKIPRRVSGYNLDELIKPGPFNICKLIVGSEGSLGIVTEMKLRIVPKPHITGLCIVHFHDMLEAMNSIQEMLKFHPLSLEMMDHHIISMGKQSNLMKSKLGWLNGNPQTVFIAEFEGENTQEVEDKIQVFEKTMESKRIGYAYTKLTNPEEMSHVWAVRKSGLGLLLSKRTYSRAIAFIEDITLAPEHLPSFMKDFLHLLDQEGKQAGIYGHVGSGCLHIRPYIDLRQSVELKIMTRLMEKVSDLLLEHGGAISGEHGDGLVRSWLNKKMFGDKIYHAFCELKQAFDPDMRMNPGKIVDGQQFLENLRLNPEIPTTNFETFLDFSREGGFELAVDLCNGNGMCRKRENVMCPSFQATGDEYDTTRARAQSLRSLIHGRLKPEELTHQGIHDVLDLCLECKGCKKECPSHVDMAKMKAEVLYQYQEKHGYSFRSKLFAHIGTLNKWMSPFASLFNTLSTSKLSRRLLERIGIAPERSLPPLAKERFSTWFNKNRATEKSDKKVVLFNDTFTEFNCPEVGIAAVKILRKLGYEVMVPPWKCCGRPAISKGLLEHARHQSEHLIEEFKLYARQGIPIIGLEPSCILTLKDDLQSLVGNSNDDASLIASMCITIDEFLDHALKETSLPFRASNQTVYFHGHCHQKALVGTSHSLALLKRIPGLQVREIDSGCCGMAGSFGYEKEHYDLSMQIGELKLFLAVRSAPDAMIVANGMSCRSQIDHGTERPAQHLVEFLAEYLVN